MFLVFITTKAFDVSFKYEDQGMSIEYSLDNPMFTHGPSDLIPNSLSMNGFNNVTLPNKPSLPLRTERLLIPSGQKIKNISVEALIDSIDAKLLSVPYPIVDSRDDLQPYTPPIDPYVGKWPLEMAELKNIGVYRDNCIANLQVTPAQYDFYKEKLFYATTLKIEITFEPDFKSNRNYIDGQSKSMGSLENILTIPSPYISNNLLNTAALPPISYGEYAPVILVICPNEFETQSNRFAEWKRRLGYNVKVITNDESLYQDPNNTRDIIKDLYDEGLNIEYVLLMGGGDIIKPFEGIWSDDVKLKDEYGNTIEEYPYYTDYYFGCMEEDDLFSDIVIGRFPAYTELGLRNMIDKSISYEKTPPTSSLRYFNVTTFVSEFDYQFVPPTPRTSGKYREKSNFINSSEKIRTLLSENAYKYEPTIDRIYYSPLSDNTYSWVYADYQYFPTDLQPSNYDWAKSPADVFNAIKYGTSQLCFRGHGDVTNWSNMRFSNNSLGLLANKDLYPVAFGITCLSGTFYNPTKKMDNIRSLAESLLYKYNSGCASFIGANSESWSYYNDYLYAGLFESMYPSSMENFSVPLYTNYGYQYNKFTWRPISVPAISEIGKILYNATEKMIDACGDNSYSKMNRETFHCLGDPSLKVWLYTPTSLRPKIVKEDGKIYVYDDYRKLVAVNRTSGSVYFPKKDIDHWDVSSLISNFDLSLISDNIFADHIHAPLMLEKLIAFASSSDDTIISEIKKDGESYIVKLNTNSDSGYISSFNQYGNRSNTVAVSNGEAIIPICGDFSIIVYEENGVVLDKKIVH